MHTIMFVIMCVFAPTAALAEQVSPYVAAELAPPSISGAIAIASMLVASGALAFGNGLWALAERRRSKRLQQAARAERGMARAELILREELLAGCREAVLVLGNTTHLPLSYGNAAEMLDNCRSGSDAAAVISALNRLSEGGIAFAMNARLVDGRQIAMRGRPVGGNAVIFMSSNGTSVAETFDYRAVLDALPLPVWVWNKEFRFRWGNRAYLKANGLQSVHAALESDDAGFERAERELAITASVKGDAAEAVHELTLGGKRRSFSISVVPLPDGDVTGLAKELAPLAEKAAKPPAETDEHADTLEMLTTAVAIFEADRRLSFYNRAFMQLWGLPEEWLQARPAAGEILDRLRDQRLLPEQYDFAAWKRDQLKSFVVNGPKLFEDFWSLPGGKNLRVRIQPRPFGGVIMSFEDVSYQLRLETSYNELIKVQKATLDTLQEGIAVFGPDGRLKLYNSAFARQWRLNEKELRTAPHVRSVADSCWFRFGRDSIWDLVAGGVTSAAPERHNEWSHFERSDGKVISVSLARLPDGATLATFADVTDFKRLEEALREPPKAQA